MHEEAQLRQFGLTASFLQDFCFDVGSGTNFKETLSIKFVFPFIRGVAKLKMLLPSTRKYFFLNKFPLAMYDLWGNMALFYYEESLA